MKAESANSSGFNARERRTLSVMVSIYGLRMLGLFMIFPVFALYAEQLEGITPQAIGVVLGVYGVTQALLQIPFGMASDRLGRKPVIVFGLLLFAAGSLMAAWADHIYWIIAGRALQGSGAIAAASSALIADVTREEQRTKAMALLGVSIGMAFILALILGPIVAGWIGVPGIFALTAILALACIPLLLLGVPSADAVQAMDANLSLGQRLGGVLSNVNLLRLDFGIFALHAMLTASFVAVPLVLRDLGFAPDRHSLVYLPVVLGSFFLMLPMMIRAERRGQLKRFFLLAVAMLLIAQLLLSIGAAASVSFILGLLLFFVGFNYLEANLPSLISRLAPAASKGTAMGVYSSCQFAGTAFGGFVGGYALGQWGNAAVFVFCAGLAAVWWLMSVGLVTPSRAEAAPA